jgi:hypothetical protein
VTPSAYFTEEEVEAEELETVITLTMKTRVPQRHGEAAVDRCIYSITWSQVIIKNFDSLEELVLWELKRGVERLVQNWKDDQSWQRNLLAAFRRFKMTGKVKLKRPRWFTF